MYVNPHFAERELPVLQEIVEDVRFGVLVICSDGPLAAHIPFVLHRDEGRFGTLVATSPRAIRSRVIWTGSTRRSRSSARPAPTSRRVGARAAVCPRTTSSPSTPTVVRAGWRIRGPCSVISPSSSQFTSGVSHGRGRSRPSPRSMSRNDCPTSPPSRSRSTRCRASASSARTARPRIATGSSRVCASAAGTTIDDRRGHGRLCVLRADR